MLTSAMFYLLAIRGTNTYSYNLNGSDLARVSHIKDLRVVISSDLSFNKHVHYVVPKAYKLLGFIKRNMSQDFKHKTLRKLYVALVRPHVDYATIIWNPNGSHIGNTNSIENIQRRFIKMMCFKSKLEYHRDDYITLCNNNHITTLEVRRQIQDVLFLYRIVHCHYDTTLLSSINFHVQSRNTRTRHTFFIPKCRVNVYKFSCILRIQVCLTL